MSVLPAFATMRLCTWMGSMASLASMCFDTKDGIVTGKQMNAFLFPA